MNNAADMLLHINEAQNTKAFPDTIQWWNAMKVYFVYCVWRDPCLSYLLGHYWKWSLQ